MFLGAVRSHGQHVSHRKASRVLVPVLSVPVLCEGVLAFWGLAGVMPGLARRAGGPIADAARWLLLTGTCAWAGVSAADAMENPPDAGVETAVAVTVICVTLLILVEAGRAAAKRRGQRRWRETGGRMVPPGPLTGAERAYHFSRIATLEATQRRVLERLDAQDEAWAIWAAEREKDDTRPHLWLLPGGDSA